ILPDLREARQVLAAELRVVAIGHAFVAVEVLIEFIGRDRILRQDPFGGHLLTFEDHLRGQQRGPPLEVRVDGSDGGHPRLVPFAQEAQLVLSGHHRVVLAGVLERFDRRDGAVTGVHPDTLHIGLGQLVGDDLLMVAGSPSVKWSTTSMPASSKSFSAAAQRCSSTSTPGRIRRATTLSPSERLSMRNSAESIPQAKPPIGWMKVTAQSVSTPRSKTMTGLSVSH